MRAYHVQTASFWYNSNHVKCVVWILNVWTARLVLILMSSFNDPGIQKEYELEVARARARLDTELVTLQVKKKKDEENWLYGSYDAAVSYWSPL